MPQGEGRFRLEFTSWHNFPLNAGDANYTVTGYELRQYDNRVTLVGTADNLRPVNCRAADFDLSGGVDGADVEAFFTAWVDGKARADVNRNGGVEGDDVSSFFDAWTSGGC